MRLIHQDARDLSCLDENSVDLVVTSPPYFMQAIYLDQGQPIPDQIGHEPTPAQYLDNLMRVMVELDRVVMRDRSLLVNLGDKYCGYTNGAGKPRSIGDPSRSRPAKVPDGPRSAPSVYGFPNKSLMGLPWRFANRCVDELGWVLRAEIVWRKSNATPERVRDRAWRVHEQWFHFTTGDRYYHDRTLPPYPSVMERPTDTDPDHPAVFASEWPKEFIARYAPPGGVVLDPFGGRGTTAQQAEEMGREGISVDLSSDYLGLVGQ